MVSVPVVGAEPNVTVPLNEYWLVAPLHAEGTAVILVIEQVRIEQSVVAVPELENEILVAELEKLVINRT